MSTILETLTKAPSMAVLAIGLPISSMEILVAFTAWTSIRLPNIALSFSLPSG